MPVENERNGVQGSGGSRVPVSAPALMVAVALVAIGPSVVEGATQVDPAGGRPLEARVALITGSTDGLGREVALRVAALGAHVIVHGRNEARGAEVVEAIRAGGGSASFHRADLASLAETRALADAILQAHDRLDILVNNAGIWSGGDEGRQESPDGLELRFHVNYLSGFLLTRLLLPRLLESAPSRIVNVASVAQTPLDFDDLMLERDYSHGRAYGQSKLAQILHTFDLAEELEGRGVIVAALHPATLMETTMVREAGATPRATVDEGATAVMHLLTATDLVSGQYFNGLRRARAHEQAYDAEARRSLRLVSEQLVARQGAG